ncbi:hypothetical protein F750_4075 [Streptomyces sp. PAMC 26508]|nr:hypothetical protein F750_4075 [Streptomyces sp. PAMC 26508]
MGVGRPQVGTAPLRRAASGGERLRPGHEARERYDEEAAA